MLNKINRIKRLSSKIRKIILDVSYNCGEPSHIGGALSLVEIFGVLFSSHFKSNSDKFERDRIILSKGHACLALYSLLYEKKLIRIRDRLFARKKKEPENELVKVTYNRAKIL